MLSIRKVMLNHMNSNKTVLMGDVAFFFKLYFKFIRFIAATKVTSAGFPVFNSCTLLLSIRYFINNFIF